MADASDDMLHGYADLTDKEKATLRLMLRGHDAKSMAAQLSLSVHTINERLRAARRKLSVTSSREAARLVWEHERGDPQFLVDEDLGEATATARGDEGARPARMPVPIIVAGVLVMLTILAALALAPQMIANDPGSGTTAEASASDLEAAQVARDILALVDAEDWQASFAAAGRSFREANTVAGWAAASQQVRAPLGRMIERELVGVRYLNAPPHGFKEVTFTTRFANRDAVIETVTLQREEGVWRMVGILAE